VAYRNGAPIRLTDVADVRDDAENVSLAAWSNQTPAVIVNIQRQPGVNVIEVVNRIKNIIPQLRSSLPGSVDVIMLTDRTTTIRTSVNDVQFELFLAIALVVMVIFLFLRNLSATIIPSIAVPLSLCRNIRSNVPFRLQHQQSYFDGFDDLDRFVVDDAIVVIENIARYIEQGLSPMEAALKGSAQMPLQSFHLLFSLIAVLIPLLFMGDVVGRLFREFCNHPCPSLY